MNSPEVPHGGPEEEMLDEAPAPVTAPPPTPSAARGPRAPEPAAPKTAIAKPTKISALTAALTSGEDVDEKEITELIRKAPDEYKRLRKSDSEYAAQYREDLTKFHAAVKSYVDAYTDEKKAICAKLETLKKQLPPLGESAKEGAEAEAATAAPTGFFGNLFALPGRLLRKVDKGLERVIPGAARLEKKNKAA